MASGAATGAATGAASGAAMGAAVGSAFYGIGAVPGAVIGGVIGGVAGYFSGSSSDSQMANGQAWSMYNAQMGHQVALDNIMAQTAIAGMNSALARAAGGAQASAIWATAEYNADLINATSIYTDDLYEAELMDMWNAMELDLVLLGQQRMVERGEIVAKQASSGTVIGEFSNADVVISQKTQEELDSFVVRHNADGAAADMSNARAQSSWNYEQQRLKILWEGELSANMAKVNAELQAAGMTGQAAISGAAGAQSAGYALQSGLAGIDQAATQYSAQNNQNMVNGMFQAASSYASFKAGGVGGKPPPGGGGGGITSGSAVNWTPFNTGGGMGHSTGTFVA